MISEKKITELVLEKISGTGKYLVDVYIKPTNRIFVEIDSIEGVLVRDCVEISRHIEQNFDRDVEDYELQVSSPGLDQSFKILKQYEKHIGKEVEILMKTGVKIAGKIAEVHTDFVIIESIKKEKDPKSKKKILLREKQSINYSEIKETKVVISFK